MCNGPTELETTVTQHECRHSTLTHTHLCTHIHPHPQTHLLTCKPTHTDTTTTLFHLLPLQVPVLVYDLITTELWKEKVFPLLLKSVHKPKTTFPCYVVVSPPCCSHGGTCVCGSINGSRTSQLRRRSDRKKVPATEPEPVTYVCSNMEFQPRELSNWSCSFVSRCRFFSYCLSSGDVISCSLCKHSSYCMIMGVAICLF